MITNVRLSFDLVALDFFQYDSSDTSGAVRVRLYDRRAGRYRQVMTTHLSSGDGTKDETARVSKQVKPGTTTSRATDGSYGAIEIDGLRGWFEESARWTPPPSPPTTGTDDASGGGAAGGGPGVILALDANSHPQISTEGGGPTVWQHFCELATPRAQSVWSEWFNTAGEPSGTQQQEADLSKQAADGEEETKGAAPAAAAAAAAATDQSALPVSVNKIRGPDSGQPKKIGLHAYYLIDHVFATEEEVVEGHAYTPQTHANMDDKLSKLLPSMAIPSDHYPVVVDFA